MAAPVVRTESDLRPHAFPEGPGTDWEVVYKNGSGYFLLEREGAPLIEVTRDGAWNWFDRNYRFAWSRTGFKTEMRAETEGDPWPAPESLPAGLPPVEPFNERLLPPSLRPWIADVGDRMQCPADFPAVGAVVCLGSVVGRQVAIRPKALDDWTVVPNLWGGVVGRPSLLKTPALGEPMKLVEALEAEARAAFEADEAKHRAEVAIAEAQAKHAKAELAKAVKAGDSLRIQALAMEAAEEPAPPTRRRYLTTDSTVEKLGELLRDNPRGILVFRDELVGFLKSLDAEGRVGSRAFYLEGWNGTGSRIDDRIGRGTTDVPAVCISILGGIQPGPLSAYLAGALKGGVGDDGLMQRFQLLVWPDAPRTWVNVDRKPDTAARQAAREVFKRLDALDPAALGASLEDGDRLPWLRFDAAAQAEFDRWRDELEARLRAGDLHPAMEAHLAKYRSLAPSLALLFHLADNPEGGPVGAPSLLRALAWCEYLETHARRLYAPALAPGMDAARELDQRLAALPDPFKARDVYRHGWRALDREGTAAALVILEDFGRVRAERTDPTQGGRPTTVYRVHPDLRGADL